MNSQGQKIWALQGLARDQSNEDLVVVLGEMAEWDDSSLRAALIDVIAERLGCPRD